MALFLFVKKYHIVTVTIKMGDMERSKNVKYIRKNYQKGEKE